MNNEAVRTHVAKRENERRAADSERIGGSHLSIGDFVAVRYHIPSSNDMQSKIIKVQAVLEDGVIAEDDTVWRKPNIIGHATMRPASLMEMLCNQVQWEIREIYWEPPV